MSPIESRTWGLRRVRCSAWAGPILLSLGLWMLGLSPVTAQPIFPTRPPRTIGSVSVFLPAPRELQRELTQAQQDVAEQRYVDAITRLDLILGGADEVNADSEFAEDYFLPAPDKSQKSLKLEADRILSSMPPAGLEAYELAHGTDARKQLEAAVAERDFEKIAEISRRFGHTRAGQEATLLLGRESLSQGRVLEAVMHLQRLSESPSAVARFGSELKVLLAIALKVSSRDDSATEVLKDVGQNNGGGNADDVSIAGVSVALPGESDDALQWLSAFVGDVRADESKPIDDYRMFGGNAQRVATTTAEMPLTTMRWDLPVANEVDERISLERHAKSIKDQGITPTLHPLVVDDLLLYRSTDHLIGASLETGSRIWTYPHSTTISESSSQNLYQNQSARRANLIRQRVWQDSLYGQLSSDGKAVYLLSGLDGNYTQRSMSGGLSNQLVALELEREGYLLWSVGGAELDSEPELAGVFFLGVPLPVGNELFCVGEMNGEIRLFSLDPGTGKLLWSQQIAHIDVRPGVYNGDPRRMAGLNLSYADGILVCPTSVGGIVAVDLARRTFRWGYQYGTATSRGRRTRTSSLTPTANHWRDNALMIDDGKVIVTPWDSNEMYCRDLLTGENVWSKSKPRGDMIYAAGVHDGNVILVGKSRVVAVDMNDGTDVWTLPLESAPSGRGVQNGAKYMMATVAPELLEIDLDTGKVTASVPTDEPFGNLIIAQDQLITQNERRVRAFYQKAKLQDRVTERLADNPADPWALEHQGILLLESGKRREALTAIRQAIANYPDDDSGDSTAAKQLMVTTALAMLRDNVAGATELAREIEPLIEGRSQTRKEFLRVMTANLLREGRVVEAARRNIDLFRKETQLQASRMVRDRVALMTVDSKRKMRQDRWHRALFVELWDRATPTQRDEITRLCSLALADVDEVSKARLVDVLQDLPVAHDAQLNLIREQIANGTTTAETEGRLRRLVDVGDAQEVGQALAMLAGIYLANGSYPAATETFRRLADEFADVVVQDEQTGGQLAASAIQEHATLRGYVDSSAWKFGSVKITPLGEVPRSASLNLAPLDTLTQTVLLDTEQPFQRGSFGMQMVLANGTNKILQGRDPMGYPSALATLNSVLPGIRGRDVRVRSDGHYIVASKGEAIVAIDGLTAADGGEEAVIWRDTGTEGAVRTTSLSTVRTIRFGEMGQSLSRTIESGRNQKSPISLGPVTRFGVVIRRYTELMCLDLTTGDPLWVRDDVPMEAEIWGDDQHIFVHVPETLPGFVRNARVFATIDGRELESRPVPDQKNRIRTAGRYVLAWDYDASGPLPDPEVVLQDVLKSDVTTIRPSARTEVTSDPLTDRIQLIDLLDPSQEPVWQKRWSVGARGTFVDDSTMAIYDPGMSRIEVFSIRDGRTIVDYKVDIDFGKVDVIRAERRSGMFVVTLGENTTGRSGGKTIHRSPNPMVKLSNMAVYTFNEEGEMVWGAPAKLKDFMQGEFFASDVPVLIFMRRDETKPKRELQTVILDVRDGHVVHLDASPLEGNTFQVRGDRELNEVQVRVPANKGSWKIEFTDEPRAPSPPYGYASATKWQSGTVVEKAFEMIRNVLSEEDSAVDEEDIEDLFR